MGWHESALKLSDFPITCFALILSVTKIPVLWKLLQFLLRPRRHISLAMALRLLSKGCKWFVGSIWHLIAFRSYSWQWHCIFLEQSNSIVNWYDHQHQHQEQMLSLCFQTRDRRCEIRIFLYSISTHLMRLHWDSINQFVLPIPSVWILSEYSYSDGEVDQD